MRQRYTCMYGVGYLRTSYGDAYAVLYLLPPTSHLLLRTLHFLSYHTTPHRTAPRRATPPPRAPIERIGCRSRSLLPIGMWERGMASGGCGSLAVLTCSSMHGTVPPGARCFTQTTRHAHRSLSLFSRISIVTIPTQYRHRQGRGEVFGSRPFSDISELHLSPRCYRRPRHPR